MNFFFLSLTVSKFAEVKGQAKNFKRLISSLTYYMKNFATLRYVIQSRGLADSSAFLKRGIFTYSNNYEVLCIQY